MALIRCINIEHVTLISDPVMSTACVERHVYFLAVPFVSMKQKIRKHSNVQGKGSSKTGYSATHVVMPVSFALDRLVKI